MFLQHSIKGIILFVQIILTRSDKVNTWKGPTLNSQETQVFQEPVVSVQDGQLVLKRCHSVVCRENCEKLISSNRSSQNKGTFCTSDLWFWLEVRFIEYNISFESAFKWGCGVFQSLNVVHVWVFFPLAPFLTEMQSCFLDPMILFKVLSTQLKKYAPWAN